MNNLNLVQNLIDLQSIVVEIVITIITAHL